MNDNEIKMFRSQIGGFNRDDVNEYIKSTDLKHAEEIDGLKASLAEAVQKASEAAEAAEAAEAKALGAEEAAKVIRDERDALSLSLDEQSKKLAEAEAALAEKIAAGNDLSKKMNYLKDRQRIGAICEKFRWTMAAGRVNLVHRILRLALNWKVYYPFYLVSYWVKGRKYRT